MFCSKCGNELSEGAKFCGKCGERVENRRNQLSAGIHEPEQNTTGRIGTGNNSLNMQMPRMGTTPPMTGEAAKKAGSAKNTVKRRLAVIIPLCVAAVAAVAVLVFMAATWKNDDKRVRRIYYPYSLALEERDYYMSWLPRIGVIGEYDSDGRPLKEIPFSTAGVDVDGVRYYEYDARRNLIKVRSSEECFALEYDARGNLTKVELTENDGFDADALQLYIIYEYDAFGNLIKLTVYNGDGSVDKWMDCEYDASGNPIKVTHKYSYSGNELRGDYVECQYDASGDLIKEISRDLDGSSRGYREYEYDAFGKQIKVTEYDAGGNLVSYEECGYDAGGNLVSKAQYRWEDGKLYQSGLCEYNGDGNVVRRMQRDSNGINSTGSFVCEYDAQGRQIKVACYHAEDFNDYYYIYQAYVDDVREYCVYEYDEDGNFAKIAVYDGTETLQYYVVYEYDKVGNITKFSVYDGTETLCYYAIYEYSGDGSKISETDYDGQGSILTEEDMIHYESGSGSVLSVFTKLK